MSPRQKLRCAIYTRKSSEEGLDQEFNSLDAQREACAAFIVAQTGLGWKLVPDCYDDGGISGGTMERPALQRLLQHIRDGKIDVVVVYKIDRLTRSLADFARIVEVFDGHGVSFVSVTQQFNTTTSMGRLSLNVLLSFAQFEREVTAERIRDKIAASRKKGMWMGGRVPLGYRAQDRKLLLSEPEAAFVRDLFRRYLEIKSVSRLAEQISREACAAMSEAGENGKDDADQPSGNRPLLRPISRGMLYSLLANPVYIGKVRHKGDIYEGEHDAIIDPDLFAAVQKQLKAGTPVARGSSYHRDIHLLTGLLFDDSGDRLAPTHARNHSRRYRYYISSRLKGGSAAHQDGWRIPATEIEALVLEQLKNLLTDSVRLSGWMQEAGHTARINAGLEKAWETAHTLKTTASTSPAICTIVHMMVQRIDLARDRIRFTFDRNAITHWLADIAGAGEDADRVAASLATIGTAGASPDTDPASLHVIDLSYTIRQRGVERRLVIEGQSASPRCPDRPLIAMIAKAHAWLEALTDGQELGRKDVAERFGVHPAEVSRLLPFAFLSPRIVEAILTGRQPADLSVRHLVRGIDLPVSWAEQAKLLGM